LGSDEEESTPRNRLPCLAGIFRSSGEERIEQPCSSDCYARTAGCVTQIRGDLAEARACEVAIGFEKFGMVEDEVRQRFSETLTRRTASRLPVQGAGFE
jgi:hypothetical protein